jgi:sulfate transport system permease protein
MATGTLSVKPAVGMARPPLTARLKRHSILPGFGLATGYTVFYLSLIVIIPLATIVLKTTTLSLAQFWNAVSAPRVLAAYELSFGIALLGALVNAGFGLLTAWVLVRYAFPGKTIVDALVDLPFALPTAVGGIALTSIYAPNGWIGSLVAPLGLKIAYTRLGVLIALTFIGLPFVVRTVEPVLLDLDREIEEAAATLGANRWQTFWRVILPTLLPAVITGFALAFARGVGEYGSVIFIAGNLPLKTEIAPLLIVGKLEEYDYGGATAIALVMLVASFLMLLAINRLHRWSTKHESA